MVDFNVRAEVERAVQDWMAKHFFLATVVSTTGNQITVKRLGQSVASGPHVAADGLAASVSAGNVVWVVQEGGHYYVICKFTP
ncbi:MAG: hypothetical protein AB7U23_10105 [Dehalococcoidia bacterium]